MKLDIPCQKAIFLRRPNRFLAEVSLDGTTVLCHVANPGRLTGMLHEGQVAYIKPVKNSSKRKTAFDLFAIENKGVITTIDSRLPGILIGEALMNQLLEPFKTYTKIRPEYKFGNSRIDFLCEGEGLPPCLIEVKSAATSAGPMAIFPDAPTKRGRRHLEELTSATEQGYRCAVILACQAGDAQVVGINEVLDYDFGQAFRKAQAAGVEAYAYQQIFTPPDHVVLGKELPVCMRTNAD